MNQQQQTNAKTGGLQGWEFFRLLLLGVAAIGCFFLFSSLFKTPYTGTVVSRGRISSYEHQSGVGKNSSTRSGYSSDVRVRKENSTEIVTVYYRVSNLESIPQPGDQIQFADSFIGFSPYPDKTFITLGLYMIAIPAIIFLIRLLWLHRKKMTDPTKAQPLPKSGTK